MIYLNKSIGVIGGDERISFLIEMISEKKLYIYGQEKYNFKNNVIKCDALEEFCEKSDIIISGIPLSKNENEIYAPFSKNTIIITDLLNNIKGKVFIAGGIRNQIKNDYKDIKIIDLLSNEKLTIKNAIPTAEGAIKIAIEESNITLNDSNCLILGFGRIGKILAKMLKGIGSNVYCEARKQEDLIWIKTLGYTPINLKILNKGLKSYDFIFNTIPHLILDKDKLQKINKECLIIDLASNPGGVDFEEANKLGIKTNWALALPGKIAPKTSAKYIKEVIYDILEREI